MVDDSAKKDQKAAMKYYKLEFQEAKLHQMVFETIKPRGKYFGINICSQKLINHMEENHKAMNKLARIRFYIVPKAYFIKNSYYYVILELKVFQKSNFQYFYTAENILVKFKMTKNYKEYNTDPQ